MDNRMEIALIYGSDREGRLCDSIANWTAAQLEKHTDYKLQRIDPADLPQPRELRAQLARAEGFVVVTPEYNHGYPAPLKALIDSAKAEWQAKPVAFVGYGGLSGGIRALEQLRLVFAELHAVTLRDSVTFINAWEQFDSDGQLQSPERAERSMKRMLAYLHWWLGALRDARRAQAYGEIAQ
ncbi:NAD(P)H-dependent oxidoreductase [Microbulbifer sp. SAOS-129_SWC]|uniref:NADPH-dependent FMN reductase n=1 Tax=Microbulbifer sp. SAOS-129_SWC TaxID=3145235 RepID=UPI0032177FAD